MDLRTLLIWLLLNMLGRRSWPLNLTESAGLTLAYGKKYGEPGLSRSALSASVQFSNDSPPLFARLQFS